MDRVSILQQQLERAQQEQDHELALLLLTDLGDCFFESNNFLAAIDMYNRALEIADKLGKRQNAVGILGRLGDTYKISTQNRKALAAYQQALQIAGELHHPKLMMQTLSNLGLELKDIGGTLRAIELYEQALVLSHKVKDPAMERTLLSNLGNAYAAQGMFDEAIVAYEQALEIANQLNDKKARGVTLSNLGNVYASQGQAPHAIELYKQALAFIQSDLDFATVYRNRGNAYIALEDFQRAIEDYEQAIRLSPHDVFAYIGKADALVQLKHYEEALTIYNQAITLSPNDTSISTSKGDMLVQLGLYQEAVTAYNRAIELDPDDADAYAGKGDALTNLRRYEEAAICYDRAIQLSDDDIYRYQKQQLLEKIQAKTTREPDAGLQRTASLAQVLDVEPLLAASASPITIKRGDVVEGVIVRIDQDEILVDIGLKSEGVLSTKELPSSGYSSFNELHLNDKVLVYVIQPETAESHPVLSLKRANTERQWRIAEEQYKNNELLKANVIDYNKGGLIVDVSGIRGFIPISQILNLTRGEVASGGESQETAAKLESLEGKELQLKIIEINRARNRLILSERLAVQEWRQRRREELLDELKPGEVRKGVVSNLANFGAFVDLGGADGLVHISQLAWSSVNHPSEVLHVGQEVEVQVLSVDKDKKKIALSIKRAEVDPWTTVEQRYSVGQFVTGVVTKIAPFGAFARIEDGIEGLIHLSELPAGVDPKPILHEGSQLQLRILRIDAEHRRLGLSLHQVDEFDQPDVQDEATFPEEVTDSVTPEQLTDTRSSEAFTQTTPEPGSSKRGELHQQDRGDRSMIGNLSLDDDGEMAAMAEAFRAAARQRNREELENAKHDDQPASTGSLSPHHSTHSDEKE